MTKNTYNPEDFDYSLPTNHHERRRRSSINCSSPQIVDQSFKKMCDINNIMAQYAKTGMLPHFKQCNPRYIDTTELPNLMEAYDIVKHAQDQFYELPSAVRKAMDHNPANLEQFLSDPENTSFLLKHGVLEDTTPKPRENTLTEGDIKNLKGAISASEIVP
jgi:phage internal scaffolding protein